MSIERAAAPHRRIASERYPAQRATIPHRPMSEAEIHALRPLLMQFVQHVAATFAECRCSVQLFETTDSLRTVAVSDLPLGMIGQASFPLGVGIAGWVGQTAAPLLIHDVTKEPRFLSLGRESAGAIMCVPMTDGASFFGTMTAWSPRAGAFHRGTLATLRAYAQGAGIAVAQAHRAMEQEATAHRATMLLALTRAVTACEDPRQALEIVMPFVCNVVEYTVGVLVTEEEERDPNAHVFAQALQTVGQREQLRQWAVDAYTRQRDRAGQGPRVQPLTDIVAGHMVFAVPLRAAGALVGLACYFHTEPFDPAEQQTLIDCSSVIGTAVYNVALFRQMMQGKERFETVFACTTDGFLLLDEGGATALDANCAFYELTKIDPATVQLPMPAAALEERWIAEREEVASPDPSAPRRWHLSPDATRDRYLEVTESRIMIGETPHHLRVFHDATAMHRVEQTRAEFMGVVSHELRNPLASIYGFLNILTQGKAGPLTAMQRDFLASASLSVKQLWRLVDDINDLVQSDLGRLVLQREPVEIGGLIRAAVEAMQPLLENAGMRVETHIAKRLPATLADPVRLHQVLNNLLSNAMKFSEPGTAIHVAACLADEMIRVSVRDTGPGIAPEDAERIFERFVKGTNNPQQDASGLGLGLAVVRQLVISHGGRVWVEGSGQRAAGSEQQAAGSTFVFTLPVVGSST
jgi:signal transduction histidine kinase